MGKDGIVSFYEYSSSDYPRSALYAASETGPAWSTETLLLPVLLISVLDAILSRHIHSRNDRGGSH